MQIQLTHQHVFTEATREIAIDGPEVGTLTSADAGTITSPFDVGLRYYRNDDRDWRIEATVFPSDAEKVNGRRPSVRILDVDYCNHAWLITAAYAVHPDDDLRFSTPTGNVSVERS